MSLFGTDGVRGIPGRGALSPEAVRALGRQALLALRPRSRAGERPLVLLGRDTRPSGPALTRSLAEGLASAGARTADLGVAPTPAVSFLVPRLGAVAGAVVSASHNPAEYNGIKFFDARGRKLSPREESRIERLLARGGRSPRAAARLEDASASAKLYLDFLRSAFPADLSLEGTRLVLDCARGAASPFAPELFRGLGAEVIVLNAGLDGRRINEGCGALHPEALSREVRRRRADAGAAFDGDADRAVLCDEKGELLDGDAVIGAAAARLFSRGALRGGKVAVTVMSNYGLTAFLRGLGVGVVTTPVGDRWVTEALEAEGLSLGGENSGHVVFRDFAPTGDGMLTALQTLAAWRESGRPMSALRRLYRPTPQVLRNLRVAGKPPLDSLPATREAVRRAERALAGRGRVFLRYSGTEPLLRVLVEGPVKGENARLAAAIAKTYLSESGQEERT